MRPYRIFIGGKNHMSGGIRALHVLRDELRARGLQAEMTYESSRDEEAIMVYPEIVSGNPENYPRFLKWLLNTAHFPGEECWAWEVGLGCDRLLTVNMIEMDLWRDRGLQRSGVAYWIGKGVPHFDASLLPPGAREISRSNHPDRAELAEYVAGLDLLISFDPFTAVTLEAVISGTPVIILAPDPGKGNWTPYGVSWGLENEDFARATVHMARGHYESLLPIFTRRIDAFAEATQTLFAT